jgi:probable rRNA maturation factor
MSHHVAVSAEGLRVALSRRRVAEIALHVLRAERARDARISITFVGARRIATLNERHLGHSGATDVISFALPPDTRDAPLAGDIYIAPDVARRNAREHGTSVREELTRLVVHGVLHVLGFDHPDGRARSASPMWRRQESIVAALAARRAVPARPRRITSPTA